MRIPLTVNVHLEQADPDATPRLDMIESSDGPAWPRVSLGYDVSIFFRDLVQAEAFGAAIVAQAQALARPCVVVQDSAHTFRCETHDMPVKPDDYHAPDHCEKGRAA